MKLLCAFLTAALIIGSQNMVVKKGSHGLQSIVCLSSFSC